MDKKTIYDEIRDAYEHQSEGTSDLQPDEVTYADVMKELKIGRSSVKILMSRLVQEGKFTKRMAKHFNTQIAAFRRVNQSDPPTPVSG